MRRNISLETLTQEAFLPFGQVIDISGIEPIPINQGTTKRFHALATADPGPGGRVILSIFRGMARPRPLAIEMLERHPLGTQAFMPLSDRSWLVIVAERPETDALRCFRATGQQGVQYAANVWHHPLLVLEEQDFLVADRDDPVGNFEDIKLVAPGMIDI